MPGKKRPIMKIMVSNRCWGKLMRSRYVGRGAHSFALHGTVVSKVMSS